MPPAPLHTPKLRRHKPSQQGVVILNGHDHYLGKWPPDLRKPPAEVQAEYDRRIAEWLASGRQVPRLESASTVSVNEVMLAYVEFATEYYQTNDGSEASELKNVKLALRPLKALYGHTAAADFDSLALEALRNRMIKNGLCRSRINKDISRIKRMFRWLAGKKLVPLTVFQQLQTVEGLRAGRSAARETEPVKPVPAAWVEATLPFLRPQTRAMVQLQQLTGMRPGEALVMRTCDLDMSGKVWMYRPGSDRGPAGQHKNAWRGHKKVIMIGPRGQEILKPWLRLNLTEYLFQPRESRAAFDLARSAARKVPIRPSDRRRQRKKKPRKQPGLRYTPQTYCQSIHDAVDTANRARVCQDCKPLKPDQYCAACKVKAVPRWHPNQLRHAKATEIRKEAGLDAARVVLGHRSPAITEVYAELDVSKAAEVMEKLG